jgi:SAM-dependent methyltransferase
MPDETKRSRDQVRVLTTAEGFFQSSVLFALLKLKVFEHLGTEGRTVDALAEDVGAPPDRLARLLNGGVVFGLLETADGTTYRVAPAAAVLLPEAGEHYVGDWIRTLDYFHSRLDKLDEATKAFDPSMMDSADLADQTKTRDFILAMHSYAALRGKELARFLDTTGCRSLLDVGAGPGTFAFHLGAANPDLELYLLDLPAVLEVAKEVRAKFDLTNETHYVPLDAVRDEIPGTYDLVLVSNTLHMLGEQESRKLLQKLSSSVSDGGSLVVQAQFLRDDRLGDRWPVMIDLIHLSSSPEGANHSVAETREWLEEAGFSDVEYLPMTLLNTNSLLRGYKR